MTKDHKKSNLIAQSRAEKIERFFNAKQMHAVLIMLIAIIGINAGLQTIPAYVEYKPLFIFVNLVILGIFSLELGARLILLHRYFFTNFWNVFDAGILGLALCSQDLNLSVLLVLRALHSLHTLDLLKKSRHIIGGIVGSMSGLGHVLFIIALFFYTFSVIATNLFGPMEPGLFGSIGRSTYTIFAMMSELNWSEFAQQISPHYPNAWIVFVCFTIVLGYVVLNFVIGTIVHAFGEAVENEQRAKGEHATENHLLKIHQELAEIQKTLNELSQKKN